MSFLQDPVFILVAAILVDLWIGDPRLFPHPVIIMGKLITCLENRWNNGENRKRKGIVLTITVVLVVFLITHTLLFLAYHLHWVVGLLVEIYLISTTIAAKGLSSAAKSVLHPLENGKLDEARRELSMIVGRDTESLSESEIIRGTVETVAENTVDGITAPLFWAIIGGAPFALAYRAINTLDSMVGYKDVRYLEFGWASAKLDDLVNWLPARMTALSMWLAAIFIKESNMKNGWKITRRDARKHPSPNSGWSEAMVAGLTGIQLGGINFYRGIKSVRATMGDPLREFMRSDIEKAIVYMHGGWMVFLIIGLGILLLFR
ncbi:MAG: cobalamin biosynthesis protein CobD [Neobacillus sp.]|nr:cobalamin biosynthesis protein CobD [Neobacillus sp.]